MPDTSFYATGRRKSSIARVWLFHGQKGFTVNGRDLFDYLKRESIKRLAEEPLHTANLQDHFRVRANVQGGGLSGQADAIRLGVARALVRYDEKLKSAMRQGGFLTRDPRKKERKKAGRKSARRSFQYTKR